MTTTATDHGAMPRHDDLIRAYLAHMQLRGCTPDTLDAYRLVLSRAQRELPYGVAEASLDEMEAWLAHPGWSPATRRAYRAAFIGFFRWAVRKGHLDHDTAADLPQIKVPQHAPRPASDDQVATILTRATHPMRTWAAVAAYAGARCIEIWRLSREDVTEQVVRLYGKGNRERLVPTHPALWAAVEPLPAGRIAPAPTAAAVSERANDEIRRLCGDAWRPRVTMHRLRAWFATAALEATGDIAAVQQLLGHASPTTTGRYAASSRRALLAAVAGLPAVTRPASAGGRAAVPAP